MTFKRLDLSLTVNIPSRIYNYFYTATDHGTDVVHRSAGPAGQARQEGEERGAGRAGTAGQWTLACTTRPRQVFREYSRDGSFAVDLTCTSCVTLDLMLVTCLQRLWLTAVNKFF